MGDRWTLALKCAHCEKLNEDVYYAPTCGFLNFTCEHCGQENGIAECFHATKERVYDPNFDEPEDREIGE